MIPTPYTILNEKGKPKLKGRVIVEYIEREARLEDGIIVMPELKDERLNSNEMQLGMRKAKIIGVSGYLSPNFRSLKPGQKVYVRNGTLKEFRFKGQKLVLIPEDEVMGLIEEYN